MPAAGSCWPRSSAAADRTSTSRRGKALATASSSDSDSPGLLGQAVQSGHHAQVERADPGAPQRTQMPADAEVRAEVAGERAHVGARGALDHHVQLDDLALAPGGQQVEPGHLDRAGGELDLLPGADPGVGALAVDLDRADGARHLLDVPGQLRDAGRDRLVGHPGGVRCGQHVALGVVGRGGGAEADGGQVGLACPARGGPAAWWRARCRARARRWPSGRACRHARPCGCP